MTKNRTGRMCFRKRETPSVTGGKRARGWRKAIGESDVRRKKADRDGGGTISREQRSIPVGKKTLKPPRGSGRGRNTGFIDSGGEALTSDLRPVRRERENHIPLSRGKEGVLEESRHKRIAKGDKPTQEKKRKLSSSEKAEVKKGKPRDQRVFRTKKGRKSRRRGKRGGKKAPTRRGQEQAELSGKGALIERERNRLTKPEVYTKKKKKVIYQRSAKSDLGRKIGQGKKDALRVCAQGKGISQGGW